MRTRHPVFTIGHSGLSEDHFLALLRKFAIELVIDVRSSPYSRRAPQYNRSDLTRWLHVAGIAYSFAGKSLGGRPDDPDLYECGRVSYRKMAQTKAFASSLRRLGTLTLSTRVALMCAEADPIQCHRFLLIGRALTGKTVDTQHILGNGTVERHDVGEKRLLQIAGLAQSELFDPRGEAVAQAYEIQESRVAYRDLGGYRDVEWRHK
jgi:uncharacterized protein (DUF488 family)